MFFALFYRCIPIVQSLKHIETFLWAREGKNVVFSVAPILPQFWILLTYRLSK